MALVCNIYVKQEKQSDPFLKCYHAISKYTLGEENFNPEFWILTILTLIPT